MYDLWKLFSPLVIYILQLLSLQQRKKFDFYVYLLHIESSRIDRLSVCLGCVRIAVATSEYIITLIRHAARRSASTRCRGVSVCVHRRRVELQPARRRIRPHDCNRVRTIVMILHASTRALPFLARNAEVRGIRAGRAKSRVSSKFITVVAVTPLHGKSKRILWKNCHSTKDIY